MIEIKIGKVYKIDRARHCVAKIEHGSPDVCC